jgi:hypothetical protein
MKFPDEHSIGELSLRTLGTREEWIEFAEAKGEIIIPTSKEILLEVSSTAVFDPTIFSNLEPDSLSVFEWVSTSKVTDDAIKHIQHLRGLSGLALWETGIGDEALWYLRQLSNLRWLDIGDTNITDNGLAYLCELDSLDELTLLNGRITDNGLAHLLRLPKLGGLDLMQTLVTDEGAEFLARLTSLRNLRIFKTKISEAGYKELKRELPDCQIRFYHPHRA